MIQIKIEGKNCSADFVAGNIGQAISFLESWEKVESAYQQALGEDSVTYKVGEVVRIIGNTTFHEFKLGEEVVVRSLMKNGNINTCSYKDDSDYWYVEEKDVEKIN